MKLQYITIATRGSYYDLYTIKHIDYDIFKKATGLSVNKFLDSKLLSLINIHEIGSLDFRYCTKCLNVGFHSLIHQIEPIQECPYHGNQLLTKCGYCNKGIKFYFSDINKKQSFSCPYCGNHLGGEEVVVSDLYRRQIALYNHFKKYEAFAEEIDDWTVDFFKMSIWKSNINFHDYIFVEFKKSEIDDFWFSNILALNVKPLCSKLNKVVNVYKTKNFIIKNYDLEKFSIYKSTRRYLFKHYIYKHKHCLDNYQKKDVLSQSLPGQPLSTKCGFSNAFILWRMFWEGNVSADHWSSYKAYYLDNIENIVLFKNEKIKTWVEGRTFCLELFYTFIEAVFIGMAIAKCCEVNFLKSPIQKGLVPYWFAIKPQGGAETFLYALEEKFLVDVAACNSSSKHEKEVGSCSEGCRYGCHRFKLEWEFYLDQILGNRLRAMEERS